MRTFNTPFVIILLTLLLGACGEHKTIAVDKIMKPCPGFAETGKPPLVYGVECGELSVKENPADLNSREISLFILRLPAISPAPKQDPLFLIQGGPGGSSVAMAEMIHYAFADVRKNRDLIFVDQRGTGKSSPMHCDSLEDAAQLLPEVEQSEKALKLVKACADKYHQQVPFYTTPYAAQDLDLVRNALGYQQINLWGVSYGSRVALEYMRLFPAQTRSAVLDGVAPVQIALPKHFKEDAQAALKLVAADCQGQLKCKHLFGDIVQKAEHISLRLRNAQQNGRPVQIQFEHPRHQQLTNLVLTPKRFASLIFMSLYSRDLTVLLPRAIADAEREDYRLIGALSTLAEEQTSFTGISEGMRYSVICNEDAKFISKDDVTHAQAFFGMNMVKDFADVCALWPKAHLPSDIAAVIKSDVPTLLLSGARDPVTPSRWADFVSKNLSDSFHLVAPGGNHSISAEGCVPKIIAQFIESASTSGINAECVGHIVPLPMVLGANEKAASSSSRQISSASQAVSSLSQSSLAYSSVPQSSASSVQP